MSTAAPWTIGRLLQWTTDFLRTHGADNPRLDAEVLLASVLQCERIRLYTAFAEEPDEDARAAFRDLVKRRSQGAPVAYLVGKREFYSLAFAVTPDVLIPRPETELLVVELLDAAARWPADAPLHIADVGTGSGIIAVCAAKRLPHARVTAIDVSPAALHVARQNAHAHGVAAQIDFQAADLLTGLPAEPAWQIIASNPPYVAAGELAGLPRDVREHEPRLALVAGERGTEVIERLLPQAAQRLVPGGALLLEISPQLAGPVSDLLAADARWIGARIKKDLAGLPRLALALRADATA